MYLNLSAEVIINERLILRSVQSVRIKSSWKLLTDTAEVTVSRLYQVDNQLADIRQYLKPGTSIIVRLGYNGQLHTEFSGYVTAWEGTGPITLECEDEMYKLKKPNMSKAFYTAPLKDLVDLIAPGYETTEVEDVNIGDFDIQNATPAQALKQISEQPYNLHAYFPIDRPKVLTVGFPYKFQNANRHILHLQRNVKESSLDWRNLEQDTIQVRVISHLDSGQILETTYPKNLEGASQRTLNVMNIQTIEELTRYAQAERSRFNFSGYEGSLTTFGVPVIRHGDQVEIRDERYPERNGDYLVDEVVTEFDSPSASFKRVLNIGLRV